MANDREELARLTADFRAALARGEQPDIEQLAAQHPQLADAIRDIFPRLLADAGNSDATSAFIPHKTPRSVKPADPTIGDPKATRAAPTEPAESRPAHTRPSVGQFEDYELIEEIAAGGMGVVYRARQIGLNRVVALKMIKAGRFASREEVARFRSEAEAAANLHHPNIVAVHDVGEHDGHHFFTMDLVEGKTLAELAKSGSVTPEHAARYMAAIAGAIQVAHDHGILHRDLKPSNVLIDAQDRPRITDFGLAKRMDSASDLTQSGSVMGTPAYMSPEQAAGKREIGPASDIFSLGAVLYELLTSRQPFEADTPMETLWKVLEGEPTPPRRVNADIPRDLETICLKAMAKEPDNRFANAGEMATELNRFVHGEPILTRPVSAGHSSLLSYFIAAAIVLAVFFAWAAPQWAQSLYVGGEAFLRVLKMIVVPLVVLSVMSGILGLGDVRKLGRPGGYTLLYYFSTTVLAVLIGLAVVNVIKPGTGVFSAERLEQAKVAGAENAAKAKDMDVGDILENMFLMLFSENLFESMATGDLLPLILFSIFFAGMLTTMGRRAEPVTRLVISLNHAFLQFVLLIMKIAPLGIFCLVTARFGKAIGEGNFVQEARSVGLYMAAVLIGLGIHFFIMLPLIYFAVLRTNPFRYIAHMSEALLTAFSTASSSATLPVTLECAEKRAKVSRRSAEFVLPLGATINMDGTALYEAVAALFIAQAFGIELNALQQLTVVVTATLAAIGAAGIPEAGLVTMLIVLNAVNLPLEGIGLILSVDWLLDRFRTATNVFGDAVGAAVVQKSFPA